MLQGVIGEAIASLAVQVLKEFLARYDIQNATRLELLSEVKDLALKAEEWRSRALADPALATRLRVREGALALTLSNPDPGPEGGPP
jgi:hypothetical protein